MAHYSMRHTKIRIGLEKYGKISRLKHPDLSTLKEKDELRLLKWQHGVRRFPPKNKYLENHKKHPQTLAGLKSSPPFLWIAQKGRIKILNEEAKVAKRLNLKKVKHTNITGGHKAYSGGELWFVGKMYIIINGCSGRYGPKSEQQLSDMVEVFRTSGWQVRSLGWDFEAQRPVKFPRSL